MSADRLAELRRQRALLEEHLAWLDREIRDAAPRPVPPDLSPPAAPAATPIADAGTAHKPALAAGAPLAPLPAPDAILDEFRVAPDTLRTDVRKGCLLYFVGAFVLLILGVLVMYFALSRR